MGFMSPQKRLTIHYKKIFSVFFREVSLLLSLSQHAHLLCGLETVIPNVLHLSCEAMT